MGRAWTWTAVVGLLLLSLAGCRSSGGGEASRWPLPDGRELGVRFDGRAQLPAEELARVVGPDLETAVERRSLRATVDDAAYSLEVHYRSAGFPACTVDYSIEEGPDGATTAVLEIVEGPRVRVAGVRFERAPDDGPPRPLVFDQEDLESFVIPAGRFLLPDPEHWYVAEELESSRAAVEAYFRSRGLLAAEVRLVSPDPLQEEWTPEVTVQMEVTEGPVHRLRSLRVEGGKPEVNRELDAVAPPGSVVHPRVASSLRSTLREAYAVRGHPDARVRVTERSADDAGQVDLVLAVEPGPHVVLGEVRIEGHERTSERRIRRNLRLDEGADYDVRDQRESFENLFQLGVFSAVAVDLAPEPSAETPDGSQVHDVTVKVSEAPRREIYFEPGYGSYERMRMIVGLRERNLFGSARNLDIEARISQKALGGRIGLNDARFLDTDTAANMVLFGGVREEPNFETGEVGGLFNLSRRITERLTGLLGYQYRFSEVTAEDFDDPLVQPLLEDVNLSSIVVAPIWDGRDAFFFPTSGDFARVSLEYSSQLIGSSLDFLRSRWHLAHYASVLGRSVLGVAWRGGVIAPIAETDTIPLQERFFNGGENTVRAFREDQLGPRDPDGKPVGGEGFNVFTAELRTPLVGRLESAFFYDIGNVVLQAGDVLDTRGYRGGLGVGVRYGLPVGPLRLDMAWKDDPQPGESTWVLHFSVGFSF